MIDVREQTVIGGGWGVLGAVRTIGKRCSAHCGFGHQCAPRILHVDRCEPVAGAQPTLSRTTDPELPPSRANSTTRAEPRRTQSPLPFHPAAPTGRASRSEP
jgi:hypothetical protein